MKRIEINVQTGEKKEIDLTAEEIADALARTAVEQANRPGPDPVLAFLNDLRADPLKLARLQNVANGL